MPLKQAVFSMASVVLLLLIAGSSSAGTITGKVFNLDGTLNTSGNVKIEVVDSNSNAVTSVKAVANGTYTVFVDPALLPADKKISLKFNRTGAPVTCIVTGLPGDWTTNLTVHETVP